MVVDCTLRDGEQAPGVVFQVEEKRALGRALSEAGVHILDAAFPAVSSEECLALRRLADAGLGARVGATVRAIPWELELAREHGAEVVFVFHPVSDIHLRQRMTITRDELERRVASVCRHGARLGLRVFFVAEDSARQDEAWVAHLCDEAAAAGAEGAILCDTVGVFTPDRAGRHVGRVLDLMRRPIPLGIHCHNDFGLASANTLSAVAAGASIVTATVTGIGERAGNAALEEVVAALEELLGIGTGIDLTALPRLAEMVERFSGFFTSPTKPIVGRNVFSHESGVHVHGMLADPRCYEALPPERVGRSSRLVLGKHSGKSLVRLLLLRRGIEPDEEMVAAILDRVKETKQGKSKRRFAAVRRDLESHYETLIGLSDREFQRIVEELTPHVARDGEPSRNDR